MGRGGDNEKNKRRGEENRRDETRRQDRRQEEKRQDTMKGRWKLAMTGEISQNRTGKMRGEETSQEKQDETKTYLEVFPLETMEHPSLQ